MDVDLDVDGQSVDAMDRECPGSGQHGTEPRRAGRTGGDREVPIPCLIRNDFQRSAIGTKTRPNRRIASPTRAHSVATIER